jgi:asparagine synthase (glutamine-hydrolysing)
MCGIAGIFNRDLNRDSWKHQLESMGNALNHRGPDSGGVWFEPEQSIGFAHRRLSILDLSPDGHQPMHSHSKRFTITYNGEIYNFEELKDELHHKENVAFKSTSDTEVLLSAIECWGIEKTLHKISGMFAFALWDNKTQNLTLARDHAGIKPLYYGWHNNNFYFSSELSALKTLSDFNPTISRTSIASFIRYSYIPCPQSIFEDIYKLAPGSYSTFSPHKNEKPKVKYHWNSEAKIKNGVRNYFSGTQDEAIELLDQKLTNSVKRHMVSDVPLGAFLSGGVDSSLVVALMQKISNDPIKTFTIGFNEKNYNEANHAKVISNHLGTNHTEVYLNAKDVMDKIPHILSFCDEPFADSSQIPTWFISHITRKHVTVSMSGDGGDELFAGYVRYFWAEKLWKIINTFPSPTKKLLSWVLLNSNPDSLDKLYKLLSFVVPSKYKVEHFSQKCIRLAKIMQSTEPKVLYHYLVSQEFFPEHMVLNCKPKYPIDQIQWEADISFAENMMLTDFLTYLPDDILTKVDRASMSVGLEARVPLLDKEVLEFAWSLPLSMKKNESGGKDTLKKVLYKYIPRQLMERPKMGFGVPIGTWLKGPMREWAESHINETNIRNDGFLNADLINKKWKHHLNSKSNQHEYYLWNIIVFQNWYQNYKARPSNL